MPKPISLPHSSSIFVLHALMDGRLRVTYEQQFQTVVLLPRIAVLFDPSFAEATCLLLGPD